MPPLLATADRDLVTAPWVRWRLGQLDSGQALVIIAQTCSTAAVRLALESGQLGLASAHALPVPSRVPDDWWSTLVLLEGSAGSRSVRVSIRRDGHWVSWAVAAGR